MCVALGGTSRDEQPNGVMAEVVPDSSRLPDAFCRHDRSYITAVCWKPPVWCTVQLKPVPSCMCTHYIWHVGWRFQSFLVWL